MSKAHTVWAIAIAMVVGTALEFHVQRTRPIPNVRNVPVSSDESARSYEASAPRGAETLQRSEPESRNTQGALLVAAAQTSDPEHPLFDRDFAAAAARPYVEMYQREHPAIQVGTFAWTRFQAIYMQAPSDSNAKGYLVVFFTASTGAAAGFTCFEVQDEAAEHLEPLSWGIAASLARAADSFRSQGATNNRCARTF